MYSHYINNYPTAVQLLTDLRKTNKEFSAWLEVNRMEGHKSNHDRIERAAGTCHHKILYRISFYPFRGYLDTRCS